MPGLSIVIVNYRSWDPLAVCLRSIAVEIDGQSGDTEVIVVDNHSADGRLESFRHDFPDVRWIENPVNSGFGAANDVGATAAQAPRLVFLNPDTELPPGSLAQWVGAFERLPRPAMAGCPQIGGDGRRRKVDDVFPGPFDALGFVRTMRRRRAASVRSTQAPAPTQGQTGGRHLDARPVDWVTGAAVMIDRTTLDRLGGWGDMYWMYSEDVDLCRRARERGIGVYVTAGPQIVHTHGGATRRTPRTTAIAKSEVVRSKHIYAQRWFRGPARLTCHLLVAAKALLGAASGALTDLLSLHMSRRLRAQPLLMLALLGLYGRRVVHGSWRSPRSPVC